MFVFWSACLSCLPLCQSNFNGWFRSQGKYRATLESSSGWAVSNNLNYDSSLSLLVSVKVIPKSFDTCLVLLLSVIASVIASNRYVKLNPNDVMYTFFTWIWKCCFSNFLIIWFLSYGPKTSRTIRIQNLLN